MSARSEFLRHAGTALLYAADKATRGPWTASRKLTDELHFGLVDMTHLDAQSRNLFAVASLPLADAEYMAMLHPPVAAVLAAWLDDAADHIEAWATADEVMIGDPNYVIPDVNLPMAVAAAILRDEVPISARPANAESTCCSCDHDCACGDGCCYCGECESFR